jgi:hypothetical protein
MLIREFMAAATSIRTLVKGFPGPFVEKVRLKRGKLSTEGDAVCRTANLVIFTNESAAIGEYVCLDGDRGYDGLEVLYGLVKFLPRDLIESRLPNPKNAESVDNADCCSSTAIA